MGLEDAQSPPLLHHKDLKYVEYNIVIAFIFQMPSYTLHSAQKEVKIPGIMNVLGHDKVVEANYRQ